MENIIRIGHYRKNDTLGSKSAQILRVIGELSDGKWQTSEGIKSSEYIASEYTYIQTAPTEEIANKLKDKKVNHSLLDGLGSSDEIPQFENPNIIIPKCKSKRRSKVDKVVQEEVDNIVQEEIDEIITTPKIIVKEKRLEDNILEKCQISIIKSEYKEKFGIDLTRKMNDTLSLPINLNIGYDIDKLIESCKLLNLDIKYVATKIAQTISIGGLIEAAIISKLMSDTSTIVDNVSEDKREMSPEEQRLLEALTKMNENVDKLISE
jgi:hypothetical protein